MPQHRASNLASCTCSKVIFQLLKELNKAMELGHPVSQVIPLLSVAYQQSGAENALAEVDYRAEGMSAVNQPKWVFISYRL